MEFITTVFWVAGEIPSLIADICQYELPLYGLDGAILLLAPYKQQLLMSCLVLTLVLYVVSLFCKGVMAKEILLVPIEWLVHVVSTLVLGRMYLVSFALSRALTGGKIKACLSILFILILSQIAPLVLEVVCPTRAVSVAFPVAPVGETCDAGEGPDYAVVEYKTWSVLAAMGKMVTLASVVMGAVSMLFKYVGRFYA